MTSTSSYGVKYLSTRNLCQDPVELMFAKVRRLSKFPDCKSLADVFGKIKTASLIRAPTTSNCEEEQELQIREIRSHCKMYCLFQLLQYLNSCSITLMIYYHIQLANHKMGSVFENVGNHNSMHILAATLLLN